MANEHDPVEELRRLLGPPDVHLRVAKQACETYTRMFDHLAAAFESAGLDEASELAESVVLGLLTSFANAGDAMVQAVSTKAMEARTSTRH